MRSSVALCGWLLVAGVRGVPATEPLDVREFGARGDGVSKDTAAIQKAIDAAAARGGGTVLLPAGRYLSGTVRLKSHVTLQLANGATLAASPDNADFDAYEPLPFKSVSDEETTYFRYALVTAENVHHIAIEGQGAIDGNRSKRGGPKTIAIKLCQHVSVRGITIANAPNYAISFWGTDFIDIDGVTILNGYSDGIDPDASRYVRIANCYVDSYDDAICLKASPSMGLDKLRNTEQVTITNCVLRSNCNCFKFGTESSGGLRDVTLTNCTMLPRETGRRPISGVSLESVDGGHIDGVVISNLSLWGVQAPLFIRLGNRGRGLDPPVPGSVENISISHLVARSSTMTSSVTGIPGYPVRRVALSGISISMEGGRREAAGLEVPEHTARYPEATMFGILPAFGLYARHAEGLTLSNVHLRWEQEDVRPAMVFDDVKDLTVDGFRTETMAGSGPVVWLKDVAEAMIRGARPASAKVFVRVSGAASRGIVLVGNDLSGVERRVELAGAAEGAVREACNAAAARTESPPAGKR